MSSIPISAELLRYAPFVGGWQLATTLAVVGVVTLVLLLQQLLRAGGVGANVVSDKPNLALTFIKMCLEFRRRDLVAFVSKHTELFAEAKRTGDHAAVTSHFYDLMGSFIALYYGPCWHFVPPEKKGQTRAEAVQQLHQKIARMLQLSPGKTALDIGCGIGGMIHDIAHWSGGNVTGLTLSTEEVCQGNEWIKQDGLAHQCKIVQGDAQDMPFENNSFDSAYAVYALKYLTKLDRVLEHTQRTLKPGGLFLVYDIIKTDNYDDNNLVHRKIVGDFEFSCGMPAIHTRQGMIDACAKAGLECVTKLSPSRDVPWYYEFDVPVLHFFLTNPVFLSFLGSLETLQILPVGFRAWLDIFVGGTVMNIYRGGKMNILTGADILIFRKPLTAA